MRPDVQSLVSIHHRQIASLLYVLARLANTDLNDLFLNMIAAISQSIETVKYIQSNSDIIY